jgi:DNA-binding response OmpR family regulator
LAQHKNSPQVVHQLRVRVLVVCAVRSQRDAVLARLRELHIEAASACDASTAAALLEESDYDVALVGDGGLSRQGLGMLPRLMEAERALSCILVSEAPTLELATAVMRAGGVDLVGVDAPAAQLEQSLQAACRRSRGVRARDAANRRRTMKLRAACRQLHDSRHELMDQFGSLCSGMADSCRDLTDQMKHVAMAAELNAVLRQELDLESLLRTVLEYALTKVGSTNAAIFLPSTSGDFSLGAYVNYDCPRESAEMLLDHLADIIAPAFEHREDIAVMKGLGELREVPGPGGEWLEESSIAAFSCRQDGECLAVVVLFRDRRNPFPAPVLTALRVIRELFGKQLARVIKTHHRHLPKNQFGGFAGEDDIDLAA